MKTMTLRIQSEITARPRRLRRNLAVADRLLLDRCYAVAVTP
jgi:hypothetical protein